MNKIYVAQNNYIEDYNILKEGKKGYITDKVVSPGSARIIDKKEIDKTYYFSSKEKAILFKIKEKEKYIKDHQKDIQNLKKYL